MKQGCMTNRHGRRSVNGWRVGVGGCRSSSGLGGSLGGECRRVYHGDQRRGDKETTNKKIVATCERCAVGTKKDLRSSVLLKRTIKRVTRRALRGKRHCPIFSSCFHVGWIDFSQCRVGWNMWNTCRNVVGLINYCLATWHLLMKNTNTFLSSLVRRRSCPWISCSLEMLLMDIVYVGVFMFFLGH